MEVDMYKLSAGRWAAYAGVVSLAVLTAIFARAPGSTESVVQTAHAGKMPLQMVANVGQWSSDVRLQAWTPAGNITFGDDGVDLGLGRAATVRLRYEGAQSVVPTGDRQATGVVRFFHGPYGSNQVLWAPMYEDVVYEDLYAGIDARFTSVPARLKVTYTVSPGANPDDIRWRYDGALSIVVDRADGSLRVEAAPGESIRELPPIAWQEIDGTKMPVSVRYHMRGDGSVSLGIDAYDRTRALTIDPEFEFSTYSGGGYAIAVDSAGYIYVAGTPFRHRVPREPDVNRSGFLFKLTPDGEYISSSVIYFAGSDDDCITGLAIDRARNVYIVGYTKSADFPIRRPAQASKRGGYDAFVVKLNANMDTMLYGTYLGGSLDDAAVDVAVDRTGYAYVTGATASADFPLSRAFQASHRGGEDVFVTKLDPLGRIDYSTYLGGSSADTARDLAVDATGTAVVVGATVSDDFPTHRAMQPRRSDDPAGSTSEAFVTRLAEIGNSLVFSTYLGGSQSDEANAVAFDAHGRVIVVGHTESPDFPTRQPVQGTLNGRADSFVARLTPDGQQLDRATYLGGTGNSLNEDAAYDVAVAPNASLVVLGGSDTPDFPLVAPLQDKPRGSSDLYLSVFTPELNELAVSTYLGGAGIDPAASVPAVLGIAAGRPALALAPNGEAVITSTTDSLDFPLHREIWTDEGIVPAAIVAKIGSLPTPTPPVGSLCSFVRGRVPTAVIDSALANPAQVRGWGELCNPALPPSPSNILRTSLSIQNIAAPYHPLSNPLVYKCGCP